jgi:hypothetical protein
MRQLRKYGSVRGAARKGGPYRDQPLQKAHPISKPAIHAAEESPSFSKLAIDSSDGPCPGPEGRYNSFAGRWLRLIRSSA